MLILHQFKAKSFLIVLLLLALSTQIALAQANNDCRSILTIKKEYIEKNFLIPANQQVAFWNIYNAFLQDESEIHENFRKTCISFKIDLGNGPIKFESLDDEQLMSFFSARFKLKENLLLLDEKLFEDLKIILTPQQLYRLDTVIKNFKSDIKEKAKQACPNN